MEMSRPHTRMGIDYFFNYPEGSIGSIPLSQREINRRRFKGLRSGPYHYNCENGYSGFPYCVAVKLYAKLGLHRYNFLKASNLQLHSLKTLNMCGNFCNASYFITLAAFLPSSGSQQVFQVQVNDEGGRVLDLTCPISRPRGEVTESAKELPSLRPHCEPVSTIYQNSLPNWPSSDIDFSDTKRFYLVKESEFQYNDWISLYVELAIVTNERITPHHKFDLKIVQVAIETLDDVEPPRLDSKNAVVYIAYKDMAKARIGEPCNYKAIVRRLFNNSTEELSIKGEYWAEKEKALTSKKPSKKKSAMLRRRLGVHRIWRLSNPRWYHAYKNRGLGST